MFNSPVMITTVSVSQSSLHVYFFFSRSYTSMVLRKYTSELTKCLSSQEQLPLVAVSLYARALISDEVV